MYPATIENIILKFPEVQEFAVRVYSTETFDELEIQVESANPNPIDTVTDRNNGYPRYFRVACYSEISAARNTPQI